jgi:hypothetical protein
MTESYFYHGDENFIVEDVSYSDWRDELDEDLQNAIDKLGIGADVIDVKPVNNYAKTKKGKPAVQINPTINIGEAVNELGGDVLYLHEDSEFIEDSIGLATEYLFESGLNVAEVDELIEEVGIDEFTEWVLNLGHSVLYEEDLLERKLRSGETALPAKARERITGKVVSRKQASELKGASGKTKQKSDEARRAARQALKAEQPKQTERQTKLQALLAAQKSRNASKTPQTKKQLTGIFGRVQSAVNAGMERDRAARATASKAVDTAKRFGREMRSPFENTKFGRNFQAAAIKGIRSGSRAVRDVAAKEFARGMASHKNAVAKRKQLNAEFENWVSDLLDEGYDLSDWTFDDLYEEYLELEEKAVSEQQQKIFGLALSVKRGDTPRSQASGEVLKIVDSMSEGEIRKFAKTKHEGIPKKVEESISFDDIVGFIESEF